MKKILALILLTGLLSACSDNPTTDGSAPVEDRSTLSTQGANSQGVNEQGIAGDALTDPRNPQYKQLQARSILFDYDSDAIKAEYVPVVEAHARYLRDNPNRKVLVQGNTDERGSREYNLALGQRRADAIKSRLVLLGAKPSQVESVSLGEEKPHCSEATEDCYAQNRRGDLVY
jgi:peptidoglycan-associated lipoprotein